jgi:tRNA threonylcarbamoyladenosine biosynthesis protein TsaB
LIIGNGASKFKSLNPKIDAHFNKEIHYPSAEDMCLLAWKKFKNKDFEVLASFEPYYLKDFQTTSSKKK